MADKTGIEWTEATWNPVAGCTHVSPGCDNCYAARETSGRLSGLPLYKGLAVGGKFTGEVRLVERRLEQPLKWKRPRRIFVNSMSDLFHDSVPDEFLHKVFAVMAATPQHTYQILTKRHARMRSFIVDECRCGKGHLPSIHLRSGMSWAVSKANPNRIDGPTEQQVYFEAGWPLPNVHVGVSVENQKWADIRIPALLDVPAAVRFLSCEPLLDAVDLTSWITPWNRAVWHSKANPNHILGPYSDERIDYVDCGFDSGCGFDSARGIDWVIVGGESGPRARPMHPDWARQLRNQCTAAGVPFHFKQWGEWGPAPWSLRIPEPAGGWHGVDADWLAAEKRKAEAAGATHHIMATGHLYEPDHKPWSLERDPDGDYPGAVRRWGKKIAGRVLDGRTWDEYPAEVTR